MTNASGNKNEKNNNLVDEFKLIQENIQKWDKYSLTIKNWAITTWAIVLIFIGTQYYELGVTHTNILYLFWIPIFVPIPFWIFDALLKRFQRCTIARSEAIQDFLNDSLQDSNYSSIKELNTLEKAKFKDELLKQNKDIEKKDEYIQNFIEHFPIFDPMCRISQKYEFFKIKYLKKPINKYFNKNGFLACFFVRIISFIYCTLIILTVIIKTIIINDLVFSLEYFTPINIAFCFFFIISLLIIVFSYILSEKAII